MHNTFFNPLPPPPMSTGSRSMPVAYPSYGYPPHQNRFFEPGVRLSRFVCVERLSGLRVPWFSTFDAHVRVQHGRELRQLVAHAFGFPVADVIIGVTQHAACPLATLPDDEVFIIDDEQNLSDLTQHYLRVYDFSDPRVALLVWTVPQPSANPADDAAPTTDASENDFSSHRSRSSPTSSASTACFDPFEGLDLAAPFNHDDEATTSSSSGADTPDEKADPEVDHHKACADSPEMEPTGTPKEEPGGFPPADLPQVEPSAEVEPEVPAPVTVAARPVKKPPQPPRRPDATAAKAKPPCPAPKPTKNAAAPRKQGVTTACRGSSEALGSVAPFNNDDQATSSGSSFCAEKDSNTNRCDDPPEAKPCAKLDPEVPATVTVAARPVKKPPQRQPEATAVKGKPPCPKPTKKAAPPPRTQVEHRRRRARAEEHEDALLDAALQQAERATTELRGPQEAKKATDVERIVKIMLRLDALFSKPHESRNAAPLVPAPPPLPPLPRLPSLDRAIEQAALAVTQQCTNGSAAVHLWPSLAVTVAKLKPQCGGHSHGRNHDVAWWNRERVRFGAARCLVAVTQILFATNPRDFPVTYTRFERRIEAEECFQWLGSFVCSCLQRARLSSTCETHAATNHWCWLTVCCCSLLHIARYAFAVVQHNKTVSTCAGDIFDALGGACARFGFNPNETSFELLGLRVSSAAVKRVWDSFGSDANRNFRSAMSESITMADCHFNGCVGWYATLSRLRIDDLTEGAAVVDGIAAFDALSEHFDAALSFMDAADEGWDVPPEPDFGASPPSDSWRRLITELYYRDPLVINTTLTFHADAAAFVSRWNSVLCSAVESGDHASLIVRISQVKQAAHIQVQASNSAQRIASFAALEAQCCVLAVAVNIDRARGDEQAFAAGQVWSLLQTAHALIKENPIAVTAQTACTVLIAFALLMEFVAGSASRRPVLQRLCGGRFFSTAVRQVGELAGIVRAHLDPALGGIAAVASFILQAGAKNLHLPPAWGQFCNWAAGIAPPQGPLLVAAHAWCMAAFAGACQEADVIADPALADLLDARLLLDS